MIFDVGGLERIVGDARAAGFAVPLVHEAKGQPVVTYRGRCYTFALMTFRKPDA